MSQPIEPERGRAGQGGVGQSQQAPADASWPPQDVGTMGMYMLVVALGMFFAASVVGYLTIRATHQPWPPPGFPSLPRSLWLSTAVIVLASVAIQRAVGAARHGDLGAARRRLTLVLVLGAVFLGLQTYAWLRIVQQIDRPSEGIGTYLKLFYVLTGLHAAHVLGGLATLAAVVRRAYAGRIAADLIPGVRYSAIYWHFLDAVWCVLFTVVYLI